MRLRYRYLIVGVAWALLLGPIACLLLVGIAAGVSWLWLFGDSPWPEATRWLLPLIGVAGGIVAGVASIIVGYRYGCRREALSPVARGGEGRKILALGAAPLLILALLGLDFWIKSRAYTEAMTTAAQREAAFAALVGAWHRITAVTVARRAGDVFDAAIGLSGYRAGEYRLRWRVSDTGFSAAVLQGERLVRLQPGEQRIDLAFSLEQLARRYRARLLRGKGGVLVEEPFRLQVSLAPVLGERERAELPPGERRRLDSGNAWQSPLRTVKSAAFAVRFIVRRDGSIER